MYAFKQGAPWRMNDTTAPYNSFFGTVYPAMVMFAPHQFPNSPKQYQSINVECDTYPTSAYIYSEYPNIQITDLVETDFNDLEGVFYAALFKDRLSPPFSDPNQALYYGDPIISKSPLIQINILPTGLFHLKYVNVSYRLSAGHHTIASK